VREARRAEHQSHAEGDQGDRVLVLRHGLDQVDFGALRGGGVHRLADEPRQVEARHREHPHSHDQRAGDQQHGLDHLDPGRALHTADEDIGDHQQADDHDDDVLRGRVADAEQQRHQTARAGHLGQQVEEGDRQRGDRGREADGLLLEPEAQHVGHRVLAGVAHGLRDQQECDQPGDEESH